MDSEFIKKQVIIAVESFRNHLRAYGENTLGQLKDSTMDLLPFEPCQFEIFNNPEQNVLLVFMVHVNSLPDLSFEIHDSSEKFSVSKLRIVKAETLKEDQLLYLGGEWHIGAMAIGIILGRRWSIGPAVEWEKEPVLKALADAFQDSLENALKMIEVNAIDRSAAGLKKSIAKIPEKEMREELLGQTKRIDDAVREINRIGTDVSNVRQMIGTTKEFQDWRMLILDVSRLKEEHMSIVEIKAQIDRLDERIDALHTRINDLKDIRFWSKRTILDISLAALATATTIIAGLLAAGILKVG